MKRLLQKLVQALAYMMAAMVILLAIAVGLFRLMLPRLPAYQEEIKDWANAAIGMQVEFSGMNALWRLSGPELSFANARLISPDTSLDLLTAEEISVGVSLIRLLRDRELVVDRIVVRETSLSVRQRENGTWEAQGMPLDQLLGARSGTPQSSGDVLVLGEDVHISYTHPGTTQAANFTVSNLEIRRDQVQVGIDASVRLPAVFGDRLEVSMTQRLVGGGAGLWQVFVEGDSLSLPGWSRFQPGDLPSILSGRVDLSLWLEISNDAIKSTTANFTLSDFAAPDTPSSRTVDVQGRIEYSKTANSWLLAANEFRISTVEATWPISSWQVEVVNGNDGKVATIDADASYVNLDDIRYFAAWLPVPQQVQLAEFDPSGEILEASVLLADLDSDALRYDLSAQLQDAGLASRGDIPGIRGFSGRIRADGSGGRLEIDSTGLRLDLVEQLTEVIELDDAMGTVIWRRNDQGITVLSDSVRIRNPDLDSESSLQISIPADGSSPLVDLDSVWSVNDIDTVERYLPAKLIQPALYRWLTSALVAGSIPRATTRLSGPIDKFPFDSGEGVFRIEAHAQNTTLRYAESWPDVANMDLDIVLDGMRLYSHRNSAVSADNTVKDARIEIDDLRNPILTIDAFATGSLQSIVDFSRNSPIATVFGGHLARISVDGDASFDLQLTYPIKDRLNYDFSTRIRTSNGTVRLQGFNPPVTELNGVVLISRDAISSEALFGTFLGQPANLELRRIEDPQSPYGVVLDATGTATAAGLVDELGAPLGGIVNGAATYTASVRFPNADAPEPDALTVAIESHLEGMEIALPVPLKKAPQDALALTAELKFPAPDRIESRGTLAGDLRWILAFERRDNLWDFDRGELAVGGGSAATPEIRGLHIIGNTPEIVLQDWLDLAGGRAQGGPGIGDRIRAINLTVGNLFVYGQQLRDHRAIVKRGAQEWVVQLDGEQVFGTVTVPYDLSGGRPLVLDMQKLSLPGTEVEFADRLRTSDVPTDPRNVPAITIDAADFALGERYFGSLSAEFIRTPNGLRASNLATKDESFSLNGAAGWVIDNTDELGQRSYIMGKMVSADISATMGRLNYEPGLAGNDMEIDIDLSFSGGPREDFMAELDGEVDVRLGAGQLDDVEPGPGRVFGLMSVVALPRRLSLDFSDVFDKGFGFDTISGSFRIVNGDAFTCDLSLDGPAADVGIVGRAGLASRDYTQTAVVSANVGNTLPIVGAVMAGPQVAAALLIFSQIFKKPLQEMGQVYYGIDGSWDEPLIESATPIRFAQDSGLAGCIDQQG